MGSLRCEAQAGGTPTPAVKWYTWVSFVAPPEDVMKTELTWDGKLKSLGLFVPACHYLK